MHPLLRVALVGSLVLVALCPPAPASAEPRTANGMNANRDDRGSSTRPVLDGLSAQYDDATGNMTLTVTFFEPLAELPQLAGWEVAVYLADNVGTEQAPICVPLLSPNNFLVTFDLGADRPAEVIRYGGPVYNLRWTVSPDRRSAVLRSADPRLSHHRLICAHADLNGPAGSDEEYSFVGAALFSGYGPLDGNTATTARWHLAYEIAALNNRLGGARRDPPLGSFPRCRRTGPRGVRCSGRSRLRDVAGRPIATLGGRMVVSYTRDLRTRWRRDMRATMSWRRCPPSVSPTRAGRRCRRTKRWRRGSLPALFRPRRAAAAYAGDPVHAEALRIGRDLRAALTAGSGGVRASEHLDR